MKVTYLTSQRNSDRVGRAISPRNLQDGEQGEELGGCWRYKMENGVLYLYTPGDKTWEESFFHRNPGLPLHIKVEILPIEDYL